MLPTLNKQAIDLLRSAGLVGIKWYSEIITELIPRPLSPSGKIYLTEEVHKYVLSLKKLVKFDLK